LFFAISGFFALVPGFDTDRGLWPACRLAAVFLGVTLAGLTTRWERLADTVASIGRRTLRST